MRRTLAAVPDAELVAAFPGSTVERAALTDPVRCVACGDYKCPSRIVKSTRGPVCLHCARLKAAA